MSCCCGSDCLDSIQQLSDSFDKSFQNSKERWTIKSDIDESRNEIGAGYLFKRAKSKPIWSRRFCTLTDSKLVYYKDQDRNEIKGTIVIAGAVAQISPNRENTKDKKYFILSHPHCGMREFYASTSSQRDQWIESLNLLSNSLKSSVYYGKLKKLSSSSTSSSSSSSSTSVDAELNNSASISAVSKNQNSSVIWKKRWCICVGSTLDYFEHARDNQAKGSISKYYCYVYRIYYIYSHLYYTILYVFVVLLCYISYLSLSFMPCFIYKYFV